MSYSYVLCNSAGNTVAITKQQPVLGITRFKTGIFPHSRTCWNGGAVQLYKSNATFIFSENVAEYGGVLSVERECNVTIDKCFLATMLPGVMEVLFLDSHSVYSPYFL